MQFLTILGALFAPILLGSLLRTAFGPLHHRRQKALSLAATTGGATGIATVLVTLAGAVHQLSHYYPYYSQEQWPQ